MLYIYCYNDLYFTQQVLINIMLDQPGILLKQDCTNIITNIKDLLLQLKIGLLFIRKVIQTILMHYTERKKSKNGKAEKCLKDLFKETQLIKASRL